MKKDVTATKTKVTHMLTHALLIHHLFSLQAMNFTKHTQV